MGGTTPSTATGDFQAVGWLDADGSTDGSTDAAAFAAGAQVGSCGAKEGCVKQTQAYCEDVGVWTTFRADGDPATTNAYVADPDGAGPNTATCDTGAGPAATALTDLECQESAGSCVRSARGSTVTSTASKRGCEARVNGYAPTAVYAPAGGCWVYVSAPLDDDGLDAGGEPVKNSPVWTDVTFALTSTDPDAAVLIDDFAVGTRGCTNYKAINYDKNAVVDDGNCNTQPCCNLAYATNCPLHTEALHAGHAHPACVHTDSKACNAFLHDDAQCKFPDATDEYTKMQAIIATLKANQNRIDNFLKDTNHMLGVV